MVTSALCQEIVSPLKLRAATHWGTLKSGGLSESERHLVGPIVHIPLTSQRMAHPQGRISWNKCEYKRMNLRWVKEVGPQPQSDSEWLRDNFCLSSQDDQGEKCPARQVLPVFARQGLHSRSPPDFWLFNQPSMSPVAFILPTHYLCLPWRCSPL